MPVSLTALIRAPDAHSLHTKELHGRLAQTTLCVCSASCPLYNGLQFQLNTDFNDLVGRDVEESSGIHGIAGQKEKQR